MTRNGTSRAEIVVLGGLAILGLIEMALHPRRTARILRGGNWFE